MVATNKNIQKEYLSNSSDVKEIKKYIHKFWKKNHILVKNKKLFDWLHISTKGKVDFIINKKNKKIISILGVINNSRDKNYSEISVAIWHSIKKIFGLNLFLKIILDKKIKVIKATTISPSMIPFYKSMGFIVKNFNQYYITNLKSEDQKITFGLKRTKMIKILDKNNLIFNDINELLKIKKKLNRKYIKWRYCSHPTYKYYYLSNKSYNLILICRIVEIKNSKFISVVDYIGSFKTEKNLSKKIASFLIRRRFHHIEFLHYGSEDNFILSSGFKKANFKQILPIYSEPFTGLKKIHVTCGYKSKIKLKKIKMVRSDGDSDRPNM